MIPASAAPEQIAEVERWLEEPEHTLEFKEARSHYDYRKLREYAAGIANSGGGRLIFGVSDAKPRKVVGSQAFLNPEKIEGDLCRDLHHRVDFQEIMHPKGRILVLHVPRFPAGRPLEVEGRFLRRAGESLIAMDAIEVSRLTRIDFDYSSSTCEGLDLSDLDEGALSHFRRLDGVRRPNLIRESLSTGELLHDYGLMRDGLLTVAALLLFARSATMDRFLPAAELVFEFRFTETQIRHDDRRAFRSGFLLWQDELWKLIDQRNRLQFVQEGFINRTIRTFTEGVVREAILNAISHRDYQVPGSVFVLQGPTSLQVTNPGGFPAGITPETALRRHHARNRLLAESLERCGLVERSGQGVDLMFDISLREGKPAPDYAGSSEYEVRLLLRGDIQNQEFIQFVEKAGRESGFQFGTEDLIVLDHISRSVSFPREMYPRVTRLLEAGIIERVGRGRGTKFLLSRRFYSILGLPGRYTAKIGLSKQANKTLIWEHIQRSGEEGASFSELQDVLPAAPRSAIKGLLEELRDEGKVIMTGATRGAKWHVAPVEILGMKAN